MPADTTFLVSVPPKWLLNVTLPGWVGFLCGQEARHVRPWVRASVEGKLPFLATKIWLPSLTATFPFPPDGPGVEGHRLSLTCLFPWQLRNLPASLLPKYGPHCPYSGIKRPLYRWFWKASERVPVLAYLVGFFFSFASGFLSLCVHSAFLVLSSVPHPEGHLFVLIKTCIFFFFTIFWWIFWNTPFPDIPMALFRNWINISLSLCNLSMDLTH